MSRPFVMFCAPLAVVAWCTAACDREAPTRAKLDSLVRQAADRHEVARQLGTGYELYEKSNTSKWKELERYWGGARAQSLRELREKAERYPKVMYYTTAWTTTWVFLDDRDIARDYYQGTQ